MIFRAILVMMLLAGPAIAGDRLIDGVPIPDDVHIASTGSDSTSEQRQWTGVWVGAWGGSLKHILIVESVIDGHARVVYAVGDNPGIRRMWSRHDATVSGSRLEIAEKTFPVRYEMAQSGTLHADYARGNARSVARMRKQDIVVATAPGTSVEWTLGKSELLRTDMVESGAPVRLEIVTFRPPGRGPFPLAVFNHGSTGRGTNPTLFGLTWSNEDLADFLNERGWLVAFPQRRGRGRSDGLYDEGFSDQRANGYTCEVRASLAGAERALQDIEAAVSALRRQPDVANSRILMGGQSRGGALAIAYAGRHPEQTAGVINFVGGWLGTACDTALQLNSTIFGYGGGFHRPTLWLYGHRDPFYPIEHSRQNFVAFLEAGGAGSFLEFDVPGLTGHELINDPDLWRPGVAEYLKAIAQMERQ